jgi:hypothetical protein
VSKIVRTLCGVCGGKRLWCRACHLRRCKCLPSPCEHDYKADSLLGTWRAVDGRLWVKVKGQKPNGNRGGVTFMPLGKAKQRMGLRRAAEKMHAEGKAYKWDSETAREAARKRWKKVKRSKRLGGIALGLKLKKRKPVDKKAMRERYSGIANSERGVHYCPLQRLWFREVAGDGWTGCRVLSERAALIRLGHLPSTKVFTPDEILRDPVGKQRAARVDAE